MEDTVDHLLSEARRLAETQVEDFDPYWEAVRKLHELGDRQVFDAAEKLAGSELPIERQFAADILGQLGRPSLPFRARSLPILRRLLEDTDSKVVESAVHAAGHLGARGLADALVPLQEHDSRDIRLAIAMALGGEVEPVAVDILVVLCADSDPDVRSWATFGLGAISDVDSPAVREALVARLQDDDPETRGEALVGLARLKDERVLGPLLDELQSDSVGRLAVEAATELADPRLRAALQSLSASRDLSDDLLTEALEACSPK